MDKYVFALNRFDEAKIIFSACLVIETTEPFYNTELSLTEGFAIHKTSPKLSKKTASTA